MTSARRLGEHLEDIGKKLQHLDLPDETVEQIDDEIKKLDQIVATSQTRTRSVMEWWGVGRDFWRKMDVDEYIRKERASWR